MNVEEEALADRVYAAIQHASSNSERAQQAAAYQVGVSDIGHCQEYLRRTILQEPHTDVRDFTAAFLGTAVGDHVEKAVAARWPGMLTQVTVSATFDGPQATFTLPGHVDLIHPEEKLVADCKTTAGLDKVRRTGPSQQQLFQRHLYALGAHQAGLFDCPIEEVRTANIWVDRSGSDHDIFCHSDTFNPDIVKAAAEWLTDVVYAVRHGEEAMREPSREFCERFCSRYSACRARDTDVRGLLTDPEVLAAVDMYREAGDLEKQAHRMRNEAQIALKEVQGSTGEFAVRWVSIPGGPVAYERRGYQRLSIQRLRK